MSVIHGDYSLTPFPEAEGYRVRIRRQDGKQFSFENAHGDHFDTLVYADREAALKQAREAIDSGVFVLKSIF